MDKTMCVIWRFSTERGQLAFRFGTTENLPIINLLDHPWFPTSTNERSTRLMEIQLGRSCTENVFDWLHLPYHYWIRKLNGHYFCSRVRCVTIATSWYLFKFSATTIKKKAAFYLLSNKSKQLLCLYQIVYALLVLRIRTNGTKKHYEYIDNNKKKTLSIILFIEYIII